jgi:hypothetical protein
MPAATPAATALLGLAGGMLLGRTLLPSSRATAYTRALARTMAARAAVNMGHVGARFSPPVEACRPLLLLLLPEGLLVGLLGCMQVVVPVAAAVAMNVAVVLAVAARAAGRMLVAVVVPVAVRAVECIVDGEGQEGGPRGGLHVPPQASSEVHACPSMGFEGSVAGALERKGPRVRVQRHTLLLHLNAHLEM